MRSTTPDSRRLDFIQSLRGVAAILVLLLHVTENARYHFTHAPFLDLFRFGEVGVPIFFVISGFIIFHAHRSDIGRSQALGRYAWRRATRIYPAFWVANAGMCLVYILRPQFAAEGTMDPGRVIASFALMPTGIEPPLAVAWTLQYEILFYAAFSVCIMHRRLGYAVLAAIGAVAFWTFLTQPFPALYRPPILDVLFSPLQLLFGLGILAHFLLNRYGHAPSGPGTWRRPALAWAAVLVTAAAGLFVNHHGGLMKAGYTGVALLFGLCTATLIACGPATAPARAIGNSRTWVFLGNASYSIYLVHSPCVSTFCKLGQRLPLDAPWKIEAYCWFMALAALGVGLGFWWMVEQPVQTWARKLWDRFHPGPASGAGAAG